jgi:hypothetical protein
VDSDERKQPIWAVLPLVYDRPLPEDAQIRWAWVIRHRDGVRYRYELQIVVEAESHKPTAPPPDGRIAIDIGARDLADGTVRSAYWLDDSGRSGEIVSHLTRLSSPSSRGQGRRHSVIDDDRKVQELRGISDQHLDLVKAWLATFRSSAPTDEIRERLKTIHLWRSPGRVAMTRRMWSEAGGDASMIAALDAYLAKDRHLLDWETKERRRRVLRQREQFRVFAAHVTRTYSEIVIAKRDYRRQEPNAEHGVSSQGHSSRVVFRRANPGKLREEIKRAAKASGAQVIVRELEGDTPECLNLRLCEALIASDAVMHGSAAVLAGAATDGSMRRAGRRRRLGKSEIVDPLAGQDVTTRING